ncbi:hypothetical protein [Flavobacterium pectinovorum]|uniref:hypothetical protein n=1 Tax=Flavobacterium pectinovorum TaxID=29533 RepID=UPI001FAC5C37|nr:hypothetical protein [Flavobacterium pectinovorum]MCI9843311.1 hypothetical protein [Flavobacterium pectinovorum]
MKNILIITAVIWSTFSLKAQNIELKDLKNLNTPGFQILDIAPGTIDRPANPKAFAASVMSLTNNGTAIPKNFALEVTPYWYFKPKNATVFQYLNIKDEAGKSNTFTGIFNKMSISLASVFNDSTSGSLIKNTNYIAFGLKTNLITYRNEKQNQKLKNALANFSKRISDLRPHQNDADALEIELNRIDNKIRALYTKLKDETDNAAKDSINTEYQNAIASRALLQKKIDDFENQAPDLLEENIKKDTLIQNYLKELDDLPLLQVDVAFAYSEAFPDNTTKDKRFNRSGLWMTAALNAFSVDKAELNDNLAFILCTRFINDNVLKEGSLDVFKKENAFDLGFKLEYSIKDLSISYEYIKRDYSDKSNLNSERKVGAIQYKISDGLYVTGAYGTNFGIDKNLFTLFGINYGFGKSSLKTN